MIDHATLMAHFDRLCDLPISEQRAGLAALESDDAGLAAELAKLLAADAKDGGSVDILSRPDGLADLVMAAADAAGRDAVSTNPEVDPMLGTVIDGRFRIDARLGVGGSGEVYRAHDLQDNEAVAIKFLRLDKADSPRVLRRFRREFRAVARLSHAGVLGVIAEGGQGARRYIAMEYLDGGDLTQFVGAPLAQVLPLLVKLTSALDYVHRQRIVHRDLKPANVLLSRDTPPQPKLADFGIIKQLGPAQSTEITATGALVGTIDYLAPEQVNDGVIDPRTDLYALGCLIFVLLVGRAPFVGSTYDRLTARVRDVAPSLATLAPGVPPKLAALVARLLERDPRSRPESAYAVGLALLDVVRDMDSVDVGSLPTSDHFTRPVQGGYLYRPGCVGRDHPLAALRAAARASVEGGGSRCALVVGPAGIGKSTLAQSLLNQLAGAGWDRLSAGVQDARPLPLSPFPQLLATLGHSAELTMADLARARSHAHGDEGRARARQHVVAMTLDLLRQRAQRQPCVVLLEDMHDAGPDAHVILSELVAALMAETPPMPVWLLVTSRPQGRGPLVDAVPSAVVEVLDAVATDDTRAIVARMLGVGPDDVPESLTARVAAQAQGNPLLTVSAVHGLVEFGVLCRGRDGWQLAQSASDQDVGAAVAAALRTRVAALPDDARPVLAAAAVLGQVFETDRLVGVAQVSLDAALDAIDGGLRAGVLRPLVDRDGFEFEHVRLVEVLLEDLAPARLGALHDRAAGTLAGPKQAAARTYHAMRGTDARVAVDAAVAGASRATALYDYGVAEERLRWALKRLPELPAAHEAESLALREQLADVLVPLGKVDEAIALYRELEAAVGREARLAQGRLMRKRGLALLRTPSAGKGVDVLVAALARLGRRIPRSRWGRSLVVGRDLLLAFAVRLLPKRPPSPLEAERAMTERELALLHRWIDLYAAAAHVAAFTRQAERLEPSQFRVDAYALDMFLCAVVGLEGMSRRFERRGEQLVERDADEIGHIRLSMTKGGIAMLVHGDQKRAFIYLDDGVMRAQRVGDDFFIAFAYSSRGWTHMFLGQVAAGLDDLARAERHARKARAMWLLADARVINAYGRAVVGEFDAAKQTTADLLGSEICVAFPVIGALATEVNAGVALLEGRYYEAAATYERAKAIYRQGGLDRGWGFLAPLSHLEALCCLADEVGSEAVPNLRSRMKDSLRWVKRWLKPQPLYVGCYEMARGLVASRAGQHKKADACFEAVRVARRDSHNKYLDAWISARSALEQRRWHDDPAPLEAVLDQVAANYASWDWHGMSQHLRRCRGSAN